MASNRKNVVVLGANGQVGAELSYLLSLDPGISVTAVARSEYGLALLRRMGVNCLVHSGDDFRSLLAGCDAVVDLVHPWEKNVAAMRRKTLQRCDSIHDAMPKGGHVVYASTIAVFHLDPDAPGYTLYGSTKRQAERRHRTNARRYGNRLYNLRLGQVHGAMQGCTLSMIDELQTAERVCVPDVEAFAVFVATIAEAVSLICSGKVEPDTYTLVSNPAWTYEDLTRWLAGFSGARLEIAKEPMPPGPSRLTRLKSWATGTVRSALFTHRDRVVSGMWEISPDVVTRVTADHYRSSAANQIAEYERSRWLRPYIQKIRVPGRRMEALSDARVTMPAKHNAVLEALARIRTVDATPPVTDRTAA